MVTTISILIAKLFALAYIAIGISGLVNKNYFSNMMKDIAKNSGLTLLFGFLALIAGTLMVTFHNIWDKSWIVIITIIGWISLLKGLALIIAPSSLIEQSKPILKHQKVVSIGCIIAGILFAYVGFF